MQICFGDERLLSALEFVQVGFHAREQGVDFGLDFGEEGGLCGCEVVFGDELEVLEKTTQSSCANVERGYAAHSCRLQDFRQSRVVADAGVEDVDARFKELHACAKRADTALECVLCARIHYVSSD